MARSDWQWAVLPPKEDGSYLEVVGGVGPLEIAKDGTKITNLVTGDTYDLTNIGSGGGSYGDEDAQDAVGTNVDSTLAYDDAAPSFGVANGGVDTTQLADAAVTAAKIAANAVGSSEVGSGAINATQLAAGYAIGVAFKNTGDVLEWQTDANNDLILQNTTDAKTVLTVDQDTGDVTYNQLGGTPSIGTHDHSETGTTAIASGGLATDAVTAAKIASGAVGTSELVTEDVQDIAGGMAGAGLAYDDANNSVDMNQSGGSGQVTLSSGSALVDTGISATDATFILALGVDDPNADCKLTGRLFWDDSAGTYKIEIVEDGTSVGNPTANYDVVRVR